MQYPSAARSTLGAVKLSLTPLVGIIALVATCGHAATGSEQAPLQSPDAFTPLVASVLAPPQAVLGADDRIHLVYELFVINPTTSIMSLDAIEMLASSVTGEERAQVLARLAGSSLDAAIKPIDPEAALSIGPAQVSRVFPDLTLEPGTPIPPALVHQFDFTLVKQDGTSSTATVVSGFTTVSGAKAVVLDPPLVGDRWLVGIGCCFPPTVHRTATLPVNGAFYAAQRFAIDFVQLDANGRLFEGPRDKLSSYAYYGAQVHAAAGGVVVEVLDDLPDNVPGKFPENLTPQTLLGNHVVIDIGGGRFTFYAHLQPGSVPVWDGQRVARGQIIGLLGNSGNTDAPHLHFHVMDRPSALASNGLPFTFRSFEGEGTVTTDIDDLQAGATALISPALAGAHQGQMPLQYQLLSFPPVDE